MDAFYYFLYTNVIILISFVVFIVLITVHIAKKTKFKIKDYLILLICIIGMYLFVPSRYLYLGYAFQSPDLLEKAIAASINPYEKRLSYLFLSDIYDLNLFSNGFKDGNKAIECLEKALKNEYSKYPLETEKLAILYSIKGDYDKTLKLNEMVNHKQSLSLRNIYIMNDEYDKALSTFRDSDISTDNFLKADLYKKSGNLNEAKKAKAKAEDMYKRQLKSYKEMSKRLEYTEKTEKFKTVEAYKAWIKEQAKEYKF